MELHIAAKESWQPIPLQAKMPDPFQQSVRRAQNANSLRISNIYIHSYTHKNIKIDITQLFLARTPQITQMTTQPSS